MLLKFVLPLCLLAVGTSASFSMNVKPIFAQQQHIMQLMMRTYADTTDDNTVDILACFGDYSANEKVISGKYETEVVGCATTAANAKAVLTEQSATERTDMLQRGGSICSQLDNCESFTDGLQFFECYNSASSSNYAELYTLSVDSSAQVTTLQDEYRQIESTQKKCGTNALNIYVDELAGANSNLQKCLNGEATPSPPVTTTTEDPSTGTPPITTTTTEAPVTTTTTEAPVTTTDAPITTTDAPITTTDAPITTTEAPVTTTEAPVTTTEAPITTTEAPITTTEAPITTTEAPITTTEAPITTTEAPVTTTEAPITTTEAPITTTEAPITTTEAPITTTEATTTTEQSPEEDLETFKPKTRMNMWNVVRRLRNVV